MEAFLKLGVIFLTLAGKSLSSPDFLIYADCQSKEFVLYSTNGTKLASKSVAFNGCPRSLTFAETDKERVYWIEHSRPPSIGYLNIGNGQFEGSALYVDLPTDFDYKSLQVDSLNGLVYLIANTSIVVKSLKENMAVTLDIPPYSEPSLIAIDPHNKYLFWMDEYKRELMRASMDGSDAVQVLGNFPSNSVTAIALGIPEQRIYMAINDKMLSTPYNGRGKFPVVSTGQSTSKFLSIALDSNRVYYTVENIPHVMYANKTTDIVYNYGTVFSFRSHPDAVNSVVTNYTNPGKLPNECSVNNGNCTGICVTKRPDGKTCLSGIAKDATVRLDSNGRAEVFTKGQWHSACADAFTVDEAIVFCRQQRHYGHVQVLPPQHLNGPMLNSVKCPYSAVSLSSCFLSSATSSCATGAAHVNCQAQDQGMTTNTRKVLAGGQRASEGRLEVLYQGNWAAVCDPGHFFNGDAAMALCRDLGYERGGVSANKFTPENMVSSWRQDIKCFIGATSLEYCYTSAWQQVTCQPDDVVAVECFPSTPELQSTTPDTPETTSAQQPKKSSTEVAFPDPNAPVTTTGKDWGISGTVKLPADKQVLLKDPGQTDLSDEGTTGKRTSSSVIGPAWLVTVIACVATAALIILTISLSVFCYRKRKRQDEPFGIHANPLVQQMSMMEQNELMLKYLEEKRQLGCLSDSKSSLNYNAAGVLLPGSFDGLDSCRTNCTNTLNSTMNSTMNSNANRYETFPRAVGGPKAENAANQHIYTLQKQAQRTPIWASPLPELPPSGAGNKQPDEGFYLEPVNSTEPDHYASMCESCEITHNDFIPEDDDTYEMPNMAERNMPIDPRNPRF